jgi:hypothetical protein
MKNAFGNYVIQKALKISSGFHKVKLSNNIKKQLEKMQDTKMVSKWKGILNNISSNNLMVNQKIKLNSNDNSLNNSFNSNVSSNSNASGYSNVSYNPNSPINNMIKMTSFQNNMMMTQMMQKSRSGTNSPNNSQFFNNMFFGQNSLTMSPRQEINHGIGQNQMVFNQNLMNQNFNLNNNR